MSTTRREAMKSAASALAAAVGAVSVSHAMELEPGKGDLLVVFRSERPVGSEFMEALRDHWKRVSDETAFADSRVVILDNSLSVEFYQHRDGKVTRLGGGE